MPLDDVGRLGPAGAAIGVDRRGVGERPPSPRSRSPASCTGRRAASRRGSSARTTRTSTGTRPCWRSVVTRSARNLPSSSQRQLGVRDVVAAVRVGEERFAALGRPLDRPADALARPHERHVLGVEEDLRAEAAADVGRDHAHLRARAGRARTRTSAGARRADSGWRRRACSSRRRGCSARWPRAARSRWGSAGC